VTENQPVRSRPRRRFHQIGDGPFHGKKSAPLTGLAWFAGGLSAVAYADPMRGFDSTKRVPFTQRICNNVTAVMANLPLRLQLTYARFGRISRVAKASTFSKHRTEVRSMALRWPLGMRALALTLALLLVPTARRISSAPGSLPGS
jgi:hypothetical protein